VKTEEKGGTFLEPDLKIHILINILHGNNISKYHFQFKQMKEIVAYFSAYTK
jgi:hypothetical protein